MIERESYTYRIFRREKEKKKVRVRFRLLMILEIAIRMIPDFFQETGKTCILLGRHRSRNAIEKKSVIANRCINTII